MSTTRFKKTLWLPMVTLVSLPACFSLASCNMFENTLVIGLECHYAPFCWKESKPNDYTLKISNHYQQWVDGFDVQMVKYLSQYLNKDIVVLNIAWESIIPDIQLNAVDLVLAGLTDTPERRQSIDFSNEYYRSELVLVTKKSISDSYQTSLNHDDLASLLYKKVLVSQSYTVTDDAIDILKDKFNCIHANAVDLFSHAAIDVVNGSAFAMTAELPVANAIVGANKDLGIIHVDQDIFGDKAKEFGVSIGLKKGREELKDEINDALANLNKDTVMTWMSEAVERSKNY